MVILSTSSGDGGLNVGVDAFGSFGSGIRGVSSEAVYDPLGSIEESGTVFESYVALAIANDDLPSRTLLSSKSIEVPEFSNLTETTATSAFSLSGLDFVLNQEVVDISSNAQRTGSNLIQTYTITNPGTEAIDFELIRYLDGDLNFDGSIQDTGGRFVRGDREILFETDSGDSGTSATTFIGITASGGDETVENYEISSFSELLTNIIAGEALSNTVEGDGDDEDQFIDGDTYDVTLGLGDTFALAPGESLTYTTTTIFGSGIPEEVAEPIPLPDADITGINVYRFLRTDTQTQFYTTSEVERDTVVDTLPNYELEGISFVGAPAPVQGDLLTGTSPVYRFFNTTTGIHLYTADENERAFVEENLDNYVTEGTPYYGYDTQVEGTVPLYRFYNAQLDAHFYTPNAEERDVFIESPDYVPEGGGDGIAFYVEPAPEI